MTIQQRSHRPSRKTISSRRPVPTWEVEESGSEPVDAPWMCGKRVRLVPHGRSAWVRIDTDAPTMNKAGIRALIKRQVAQGSDWLPWNLAAHGPWSHMTNEGTCLRTGGDYVEIAARMAGFLRDCNSHDILRPILARAVSVNGCNSPASRVNLYHLALIMQYSAARLLRIYRAALPKYEELCAAYGCTMRSADLLVALQHTRLQSRAARLACVYTLAAVTTRPDPYLAIGTADVRDTLMRQHGRKALLAGHGPIALKWAQQMLVDGEYPSLAAAAADIGTRLVLDLSDGVEAWLDTGHAKSVHGVIVTPYWTAGMCGKLVRLGARTYHIEDRTLGPYTWSDRVTPQRYLTEALAAWRQQDKLLSGFKLPDNVSLLIYRSDSYTAGNCRPGTAAWMQGHNFSRREFLPVQALLPFAADPRVSRVINAAVASFSG